MAATSQDLKKWFKRGNKQGATYMIVMCDTFDHEDYPTYVMPDQDFWEEHGKRIKASMQTIMEVYDFSLSWEEQSKGRIHNTPLRNLQDLPAQVKPKKVKKQPSKKDPKIGQRKVKYDT